MERDLVDWLPREYRRRASLVGYATNASGKSVRLLVTNISYAGCQMIAEGAFRRGESLTLHLPGRGDISAQVRWVSGDKCGIRFLLGISPKDERRARLGV